MSIGRVDLTALPWESSAKGARFKIHTAEGRRLRLLELSRDFVEPDWCRRGHIGYVLEGELELVFPSGTTRLSKGDGLFLLPSEETKHRPRVLSDTCLLLLVEEE